MNTIKPAQERIYAIGDYGLNLIQQKNYDQTGNLVQAISENNRGEYSSKINMGTDYSYYLQNNFATGLKSTTTFANGEESGKSQTYDPKGGLSSETKYRTV